MTKLGDAAEKRLGRQTIKIDEVIEQFDGVVTINSLSFVDYKGEKIPVFGFAEADGLSFWGGSKKLRELAEDWLELCDGDLGEVNDELREFGVRIKLHPTLRTKSGKVFRPVSMIGTVRFADEVVELHTDDADELG